MLCDDGLGEAFISIYEILFKILDQVTHWLGSVHQIDGLADPVPGLFLHAFVASPPGLQSECS